MLPPSSIYHLPFSSPADVFFFSFITILIRPTFPWQTTELSPASISTLIPIHPRLFSNPRDPMKPKLIGPGEIGNAQSAASNANILIPRVAASVSPKTLMLLMPPPPPLPPLRNREQRVDCPRGLLHHTLGSEPTRIIKMFELCMGRPQGGTCFHSVGSFLPFLSFRFMYPVLARSPWAGLDPSPFTYCAAHHPEYPRIHVKMLYPSPCSVSAVLCVPADVR